MLMSCNTSIVEVLQEDEISFLMQVICQCNEILKQWLYFQIELQAQDHHKCKE